MGGIKSRLAAAYNLRASASVMVLIIFIAGWEATSRLAGISPLLLPPFSECAWTLIKIFVANSIMGYEFLPHLTTTFYELGITFMLVILTGFCLGLCIGVVKFFGDVVEPLLYLIYAIPSVLLYPVFFLFFGLEESSKIAFGLFLGLLPMTINTIAGIRQVDRAFIRIAKQLGCSDFQLVKEVLLPASLPNILTGIRLGVGYGLIGVFVGEVLASSKGLGYLIATATFLYETKELYALILLVVILSFAIHQVMRLAEKKMLAYLWGG